MADFDAEQITSSGLDPTQNAASAGGDTVPPDVTLRVVNGDASPHTVTVVTPGVVDGDLAIGDRAVAIPAGEFRFIRVPRQPYMDPSTGRVSLTYDAVTSVTVEVIRP